MRPVCTVIFLTGLLALPLATKAMAVEVHESIFIQAVKVPDLRDTQASLSFGVLAFDFSQATESVYMFTQQIHTDPFLGLELSTQDITGAGRLILKSNGMGLGEIALRDLVIKKQGHPGPGPAQMPPLVITQVRPDGTTENSGKALAEAILLLLPVTGAEIVLGKSTKQPRRFPVIFLNQKSEATGERTVTAQRHVLYKDKLCVLFTVHDTLLQLVPAIPDASVDIRGEGYFLYEYQTKSILVSKLALRMRLLHFNETKVDSDNYYSVDRIP